MVQVIVETLFFFHPAIWWLSSRMRVEREHCCDLARWALARRPLLVGVVHGLAASGTLTARLRSSKPLLLRMQSGAAKLPPSGEGPSKGVNDALARY